MFLIQEVYKDSNTHKTVFGPYSEVVTTMEDIPTVMGEYGINPSNVVILDLGETPHWQRLKTTLYAEEETITLERV